jgi:hypothetical protein
MTKVGMTKVGMTKVGSSWRKVCVCVSVCERVRAHVDSHHLEMVAAAAVVLEFRV